MTMKELCITHDECELPHSQASVNDIYIYRRAKCSKLIPNSKQSAYIKQTVTRTRQQLPIVAEGSLSGRGCWAWTASIYEIPRITSVIMHSVKLIMSAGVKNMTTTTLHFLLFNHQPLIGFGLRFTQICCCNSEPSNSWAGSSAGQKMVQSYRLHFMWYQQISVM